MFLLELLVIFHVVSISICTTLIVDMPPRDTQQDESYLCRAVPFSSVRRSRIVSVQTEVDRSRVHHITIGVCEQPASKEELWECKYSQGSNCHGAAAGFSGWDSSATQSFKFPNELSLEVGMQTQMKYFIMQVHFKQKEINQTKPAATIRLTLDEKLTHYQYQLFVLGNRGYIPGNMSKGYFSNVACEWKLPNVRAYRYQIHTHEKGFHAEGFLVRNGSWILLGSGLSQIKRKYFNRIPGGPIEIRRGDILAVRCLYINQGSDPIYFGMSSNREMCGFAIEIGYRKDDVKYFKTQKYCETESPKFQFNNFKGVLDYF